jgi:beta-aspartyl-peptidase (threonine type)
MEDIAALGGSGGLIAVDTAGRVAMPFNTEGMFRGTIGADGRPEVAVF